jgi:hypothetical protein
MQHITLQASRFDAIAITFYALKPDEEWELKWKFISC